MAGLVILMTAASAHASDATRLRFGVAPSYAPFESKAPSGQLVGFDIDVGNEICRRVNAQCSS
ncbi:transporter substrate-binding domain-containing protein [Burkholderia anthina]|uniref:transporter substrate-binding domain-containing protein n=1 Tax=Burkholderia anthina TaxID=179879 RepID=UPI001FC894BB|nr:transporter substrate-binding domain-containing protein [Burkholderia anthina]